MPSCPLSWLPWLEENMSVTLKEGTQRSLGGLKGVCVCVWFCYHFEEQMEKQGQFADPHKGKA